MNQTTQERNKALVLEAFYTLFNKRDYVAWKGRPDRHRAQAPHDCARDP